jgi:very-short-patch-repair endonuclease
MYIQQFLEKSKIKFKSEYTIYIDENYYRFDFYLPQYNLFIEYDGQQHYEPVRFHGNNVEENKKTFYRIQEHDKIKTQYCDENNINLLRIPYWENKNIETIINNCLQRLSEKGFIDESIKYATV